MKEVKTTYFIEKETGHERVEGFHFADYPGINLRRVEKDYFVDVEGRWLMVFSKKAEVLPFVADIWGLFDWRKEPLKTLLEHPEMAHYVYNRAYGFEVEKPAPLEEVKFGQERLF